MEALCDTCKKSFSKSELTVFREGIYCSKECRPPGVRPILIDYLFSWPELIALRRFLDGDVDLEVLEILDEFKAKVDYEILILLRQVLPHEDEEGEG